MKLADGLIRAALVSVVLGLIALVAAPVAGAISVTAEAESYDDTFDKGGAAIMAIACSGASGGLAVDGLDMAGEWIEVKATIPVEACYELTLSYQAPYAEIINTMVTVFDGSHALAEGSADVELVGAGLG